MTFLPTIVESAESSPTAAAECAHLIRKFLKKDYWSKPSYQYNALMLIRILSDNPGQTFTRNLDGKFVDTLKDLLRNGRDLSVRQMLMEMLDQFESQKSWDEGLTATIEMWKKEKEKAYKAYGVCATNNLRENVVANFLQGRGPPPPPPNMMMGGAGYGAPVNNHSQNYFARSHSSKRLPDPVELANRLEEAKTSAGLLTQLVANTPSTEVLDNDLIKEFADRCLSASRSIQGYMTAENPGPDNETMESLIDVNEELQQALNSQKRAMLSARKELGLDSRSQNPSPQPQPESNGGSYPPPIPVASGAFAGAPAVPRREVGKGKGKQSASESVGYVAPPPGPPPGPPRGRDIVSPLSAEDADEEDRNPFLDPVPAGGLSEKARGKSPVPKVPVSPVEQSSSEYDPFNSAYNQPSKSYLGRQDSAMDHVQMHGAGGGDLGSDHHPGAANHSAYQAGGSGSSGGSSAVPRRNRYDYDDDRENEDIYNNDVASGARGSSAAGKKPVYRY